MLHAVRRLNLFNVLILFFWCHNMKHTECGVSGSSGQVITDVPSGHGVLADSSEDLLDWENCDNLFVVSDEEAAAFWVDGD